jgi:outer membrane receptor for ferrienterochelin and colicin
VSPEFVRDLEMGLAFSGPAVSAQANLFLMRFRNEIAPIGAINEIGYLMRRNVARSVRQGVEGDLTWRATPALTAVATLSITDARIHEYREETTGQTYHDVAALLTPKVVTGHGIRADLASWLALDLDGRYVSRMMTTNTGEDRFAVPASWYADAGVTLRVARQSVLVQVRNLFDGRVYTGGYPGAAASGDPAGREPYYYTLAPRHLSVSAKVRF